MLNSIAPSGCQSGNDFPVQQLVELDRIAKCAIGKGAAETFGLLGNGPFTGDDQLAVLDGLLDRVVFMTM